MINILIMWTGRSVSLCHVGHVVVPHAVNAECFTCHHFGPLSSKYSFDSAKFESTTKERRHII